MTCTLHTCTTLALERRGERGISCVYTVETIMFVMYAHAVFDLPHVWKMGLSICAFRTQFILAVEANRIKILVAVPFSYGAVQTSAVNFCLMATSF